MMAECSAVSPLIQGLRRLTILEGRWPEVEASTLFITLCSPHPPGVGLKPRKVRELIGDLERAGFISGGGKGGHRNFQHPRGARVTLSGQPGADAKPYQERVVRRAIEESRS